MRFFTRKEPIDRLDEGKLLSIVKKQERVFKRNDRELDRLEQKRKGLLEKAKTATPTQTGLLREQYKVVRSDREVIANEYKRSLAVFRITNMVYTMVRQSRRKERAPDIIKELVAKTKLDPDQIRQILDTGGIDDEVALSPWMELSEELNQAGIDSTERTDDANDPEFDMIVSLQKARPDASVDELIRETESKLAGTGKASQKLEG